MTVLQSKTEVKLWFCETQWNHLIILPTINHMSNNSDNPKDSCQEREREWESEKWNGMEWNEMSWNVM